ncbi:hypothetical protein I8J29_14120 [Paenibacillus sp. MWE-103]|uniref:Uncharacterized protein n=1 Tax=Paenibacillus artemisiicola TaxID=1172618 RepID=A0ABS3WAI6_9BACL|nr:hypothetical protein [Paenibacillus artemisiicola]MBO7745344.1 hypothetical protein [Paenibacillus artemisiicola]
MGTFIANIQVLAEGRNRSALLDELETAITDKLINGVYELADDAASADRSLLLRAASDRWISVYDQRLDEQDVHAMDAIGTAISRLGVPAVGSIVHDSDWLLMRLYRNGGTADTIVNDLDAFNAMMEGGRKRKRNGLPSRWAEVCAAGVEPGRLKEIWESEELFAEDALARAAELLAIPAGAALRGHEPEAEVQPGGAADAESRVLRFRSLVSPSAFIEAPDGPKLAFTSRESFVTGDAGGEFKLSFGFQSQGQAFTGLTVLLWGPALDERLIAAGAGMLERRSVQFDEREAFAAEPERLELEAGGESIIGYRYAFPELEFPDGGLLSLYPADAAKLGVMREWMAQMNQRMHAFRIMLTGERAGKAELHLVLVPQDDLDQQQGMRLPVYVGVEPDA